jgi:hypothetical protein
MYVIPKKASTGFRDRDGLIPQHFSQSDAVKGLKIDFTRFREIPFRAVRKFDDVQARKPQIAVLPEAANWNALRATRWTISSLKGKGMPTRKDTAIR